METITINKDVIITESPNVQVSIEKTVVIITNFRNIQYPVSSVVFIFLNTLMYLSSFILNVKFPVYFHAISSNECYYP